jgi:hypothetical protein
MARLVLARVRELVERAKAGDVEAKRELARILEGAGYDIFNAERPGRFEPVEDRYERWCPLSALRASRGARGPGGRCGAPGRGRPEG